MTNVFNVEKKILQISTAVLYKIHGARKKKTGGLSRAQILKIKVKKLKTKSDRSCCTLQVSTCAPFLSLHMSSQYSTTLS